MNQNEFKSQWNELKGKAKVKWGELTDNELSKVEGNRDQLIALLQKHYNYAKEQAVEEVNSWLESIKTTLKK